MVGKPQALVDPADIDRYLDRGYRILDPHLHTSASCDVIPSDNVAPKRLYDNMVENGWGFVTFTDHDTLDAYDSFPIPPERLVRGVEVKIKPERIGDHTRTHTLHVNVYQPTTAQYASLAGIAGTGDFYGFIDYLRSEGLRYALNHPFWHEASEAPNWANTVEILRGGYFPLAEYNWGHAPELNATLLDFGADAGIPLWGASDSHVGQPEYATLVRGDTFEEAWENVIAGRAKIVRQHRRAANGAVVTIRDQAGFRDYAVDTILRLGEQLREVSNEALRNKPVVMNTGRRWKDGLIRFVTDGTVGRIVPLPRVLGGIVGRYGERIAPVVAAGFVRSQMFGLDSIRATVTRHNHPTERPPLAAPSPSLRTVVR